MNLATLRLEGTDEALQRVCATLGLAPESEYKQGEPKRRGGFYPNSGLSVTIADAKNPGEMVVTIREFMTKCKSQNLVLAGPGLSAELAIGVTVVGDSEQFIAFVDFSAPDLAALGALGVELSIAAYPTSDEANAIDQNA